MWSLLLTQRRDGETRFLGDPKNTRDTWAQSGLGTEFEKQAVSCADRGLNSRNKRYLSAHMAAPVFGVQ